MKKKNIKFIYTVTTINPKHRWYNNEPLYTKEQYYLKVEDGYVVLGEKVDNK